ncbi:hypothetical protein BHE74_00059756 [Ensete ventricosum]|nr:hypothetical protein BHE74_00059756 [Ensete ventricosum]
MTDVDLAATSPRPRTVGPPTWPTRRVGADLTQVWKGHSSYGRPDKGKVGNVDIPQLQGGRRAPRRKDHGRHMVNCDVVCVVVTPFPWHFDEFPSLAAAFCFAFTALCAPTPPLSSTCPSPGTTSPCRAHPHHSSAPLSLSQQQTPPPSIRLTRTRHRTPPTVGPTDLTVSESLVAVGVRTSRAAQRCRPDVKVVADEERELHHVASGPPRAHRFVPFRPRERHTRLFPRPDVSSPSWTDVTRTTPRSSRRASKRTGEGAGQPRAATSPRPGAPRRLSGAEKDTRGVASGVGEGAASWQIESHPPKPDRIVVGPALRRVTAPSRGPRMGSSCRGPRREIVFLKAPSEGSEPSIVVFDGCAASSHGPHKFLRVGQKGKSYPFATLPA